MPLITGDTLDIRLHLWYILASFRDEVCNAKSLQVPACTQFCRTASLLNGWHLLNNHQSHLTCCCKSIVQDIYFNVIRYEPK